MAGEYTAAGAAVGSVIPGVGTAIGGAVGAVADLFMADHSGVAAKGPTGSSSASTAVYGSGLSGDNWNVNFRGSPVNTSSAYKPFSATGPTATTAGEGGAVLPPPAAGLPASLGQSFYGLPVWGWVAAGGLLLWKLKSKK